MSIDKYPLIKALGLELHILERIFTGAAVDIRAVKAEDLEVVLAKAPTVYTPSPDLGGWTRTKCTGDSHAARLLCVQPIVRDTAESLLREFCELIEYVNGRPPHNLGPTNQRLYDRARKLLEGK